MTNEMFGPVLRTGWFKASQSGPKNGCVEVRFDGDSVLVRDSKYFRDPTNDLASQPIITVPAIKWKGFLEIVASRGSSSDVSAGIPAVELDGIGGATLRDADGTTLVYTPTEWDAFSAGIVAGEFALA